MLPAPAPTAAPMAADFMVCVAFFAAFCVPRSRIMAEPAAVVVVLAVGATTVEFDTVVAGAMGGLLLDPNEPKLGLAGVPVGDAVDVAVVAALDGAVDVVVDLFELKEPKLDLLPELDEELLELEEDELDFPSETNGLNAKASVTRAMLSSEVRDLFMDVLS